MQYLIAILLSVSLLLTGGSGRPGEDDASSAGRLFQLLQVLVGQTAKTEKSAELTERATLREAPSALAKSLGQLASGTEVTVIRSETVLNTRWCFVRANGQEGWVKESSLSLAGKTTALPANVATVKNTANVYSSYNQSTRVLAQLESGAELSVLRTAQFGGVDWVYATVKSSGISGWLLEAELNMPTMVTGADLTPTDSFTYLPTYAQLGYVTSSQLNIRTAPGTNFDKVGAYSGGARIAILETNSGWGRTVDGWVYMGYVYFEGQVGSSCMIGNVTADRLNVRTGPGTGYPVAADYASGDRIMVLEQVYSNGGYWGYTRRGWVSMRYVQPDLIPGTKDPIYGFGVVTAESAVVTNAAGSNNKVGSLPKGTVVPILQTANVGGAVWGHIPTGWILMSDVDMRAVYQQTVVPPAPEMPTPEPTEPTEAPTEPTEAPTEPTEAPTDPTEEPTEPTEAPTDPTEEPTEPTEAPTDAPTEPTEAPTDAPTEPDDAPGDAADGE